MVSKLVSMVFPFLKSVMLGDKTVKQAVRTNKKGVLFLFFVLFIFVSFIFILPKTYKLTRLYNEQLIAIATLQERIVELETQNVGLEAERDSCESRLNSLIFYYSEGCK